METLLTGSKQTVIIGRERPLVIIGERINPTGRKRLAEALSRGDLSLVQQEAIAQMAQGAQVIDVNVGAAEVNQEEVLPLAVQTVAEAVEVPICIDSTHETALPAALAVCPGKPLINSVNGEEAVLARILPLVHKRGAAVIGLTMDDEGIPDDPQRRLQIARKIVARAEELGIPRNEVIIDCLALTVGADHRAAAVTLEAVRLVTQELGVNVTLGVSNVSFGLPDRGAINEVFLAMAIAAGVTCVIIDPARARRAVVIADLLLGHDEFATNYLSYYRAQLRRP